MCWVCWRRCGGRVFCLWCRLRCRCRWWWRWGVGSLGCELVVLRDHSEPLIRIFTLGLRTKSSFLFFLFCLASLFCRQALPCCFLLRRCSNCCNGPLPVFCGKLSLFLEVLVHCELVACAVGFGCLVGECCGGRECKGDFRFRCVGRWSWSWFGLFLLRCVWCLLWCCSVC